LLIKKTIINIKYIYIYIFKLMSRNKAVSENDLIEVYVSK